MTTPIVTPFTGDEEANRLLTENPFALLAGMLLDHNITHGVSALPDRFECCRALPTSQRP
jgi:hypothetical protein